MKDGRDFLKTRCKYMWVYCRLYFFALVGLVCLSSVNTYAQEIQGTVYDITQKIPLPAVSVLSTSGYGTQTDSLGFYTIRVKETDSIWFSYLAKTTPKYPVKTIINPAAFDISIQVSAIELPGVIVRKSSYRFDSIQNRREYEKAFNYRKPGLRISSLSPGSMGAGAGLDLNELINVFRFRRNNNMKFLQGWLIKEEQEKYVDHRYSERFVHQLTNLEGQELDDFMKYYRPPYEMVVPLSDAELGLYILDCFKEYTMEEKRGNGRRR